MSSSNNPLHFFEADTCPLLFHFTSAEGALAILESESLWLTDYSKMDDQDEYEYSKRCYLDSYHNRLTYLSETPRLLNTFNLIGLENNTRILIACFTKQVNSESHWQSFAAEQTGCAIAVSSFYLQDEAGVAIRTVQYDQDYISRFCIAGWTMLQEEFQTLGATDEWQTLSKFFLSDLYAFKRPEFAAEAEVRVSRMVLGSSPEDFRDFGGQRSDGSSTPALKVQYRMTKHGLAPFVALPLRSRNTGFAVKELHIGTSCEDKISAELMALAASKSDDIKIVLH